MIKSIYNFIHGRFKNKVLKEPYREIWVKTMYCTIGIITLVLIFFFVQAVSYVADLINYVFI